MNSTIKAKTAEDFLGLDPGIFQIFSAACNRVYQSVGHEFAEAGPMSRAYLVEVVLDGGYFVNFGRPPKMDCKEWQQLYKDTLMPWLSEHYGTPKFKALMKLVFPFERYDP